MGLVCSAKKIVKQRHKKAFFSLFSLVSSLQLKVLFFCSRSRAPFNGYGSSQKPDNVAARTNKTVDGGIRTGQI